MAFYSDTRVECLNTPSGQNVDFVVLNLYGTYTYNWALKGLIETNLLL
jgi:hypothetical protein